VAARPGARIAVRVGAWLSNEGIQRSVYAEHVVERSRGQQTAGLVGYLNSDALEDHATRVTKSVLRSLYARPSMFRATSLGKITASRA
jgi:hypothetical protein